MELTMKRMSELSPVQYAGSINGHPYYFRERFDNWTLTIGVEIDWQTGKMSQIEPMRQFAGTLPTEAVGSLEALHAAIEQVIKQCAEEYAATASA